MSKLTKNLNDYIADATDNIVTDRAAAQSLLAQLMNEMNASNDKYKHKDFGEIAAKYLETLQRSNEQLVKIAAIVQKKEGVQDSLSSVEKDQIFYLIKDK